MAAPRIVTINELKDYTDLAKNLLRTPRSLLWFRGIGNVSHTLIPSLFRHPTIVGVKELIELEFEILNRFKHRSIPFQTRPLNSDWEYLFFMQHYSVPTRLLDWSENSMIGLYFAVTSAEDHRDPNSGAFTSNAAVWILDPYAWNEHVLGSAWKSRIVAIPDPPLDSYKPTDNLRSLQTDPVAMAGMHNSGRIVAQRGAFSIFGSNKKPMEEIYDNRNFPADCLVKAEIPVASLAAIREELFGLGYSDSMVYPDLSGLSKEIKRHFGFRI